MREKGRGKDSYFLGPPLLLTVSRGGATNPKQLFLSTCPLFQSLVHWAASPPHYRFHYSGGLIQRLDSYFPTPLSIAPPHYLPIGPYIITHPFFRHPLILLFR